jgi:hypothetical protein
MSGDLERRYRRVLRLLPGYYRQQWEEDMVTAFLDGSMTGDPGEDEFITEFGRPSWSEIASVAGLAARLYLGGAGAPRRYFAWGQAARRAVLAVILGHAVLALGACVFLAWAHHLLGWLPAPPAHLLAGLPEADGSAWPAVWYAVGYAYIVIYAALVLGYYRTAQVTAVLAITPDVVSLLQQRFAHHQPSQSGLWAGLILLDLAPVLAMAAFHRDAPPARRRPWLLALPAGFVLVAVPMLAAQVTGHASWVPGYPGLACILAAIACLVHVPGARSRRTMDSGAWSLALTLLAAVAGLVRIAWLTGQLHDPNLVTEGVIELLALAAAVMLVAPDAVRAQATVSPPPPSPRPGVTHDALSGGSRLHLRHLVDGARRRSAVSPETTAGRVPVTRPRRACPPLPAAACRGRLRWHGRDPHP